MQLLALAEESDSYGKNCDPMVDSSPIRATVTVTTASGSTVTTTSGATITTASRARVTSSCDGPVTTGSGATTVTTTTTFILNAARGATVAKVADTEKPGVDQGEYHCETALNASQ